MLRNKYKWNRKKERNKDQIRILAEKVRRLTNQIASQKLELEELDGVVSAKADLMSQVRNLTERVRRLDE